MELQALFCDAVATPQAPDCKHGLGSKIKIGLCAMDKKV
jgi:hypothetical protein